MDFGTNPVLRMAALGIHLPMVKKQEPARSRAVTDLLHFHICPRSAHFFSEGRYPSHTLPSVMGRILHRTIKHLHGHYKAARQKGNTTWIPDEQTILDEFRIVEEASRLQGLPQLFSHQRAKLEQMLLTFHTLEAAWLYPQIQSAEVPLRWRWDQAPGGPTLLEGTVDVVFLQDGTSSPASTTERQKYR